MKDRTLKQLVESIKASSQPKTSAYDTSATVTRVENGVAWVHIPGGVAETPVKLTINAKAGDTVQVRVSGGRAFMVGNATAPPTDDHTARQALTETRTVSKAVKAVKNVAEKAAKIAASAQQVADEGKAIAEATNQHFWTDDNGAHVTTVPQETDPTGTTGFNTLWNALGLLLRNGEAILAQFAQSAVSFYDGDGNEAENVTASFGKTGAFIGGVGSNRLEVNGIGMTGYDTDGSKAFNVQFANANNTADIVEKSPVILRDYPSFFQPLTITPNATPADQTEMSYTLTVAIKNSSNQSRSVSYTLSRDYDESDSTEHNRTVNISVPVYGSRYTLSWIMSYTGSSKSTTFTSWDLDGYNGRIVSVQIDHSLTALTSDVPSYTFGTRSNDPLDNGAYSFTAGEGLIASADDQAMVGKYNAEDTNADYAFIVGNGTDDSNRSNAFAVKWDGSVVAWGVKSFTPTWETGQEANLCHCVVSAGLCSLFYQGPITTHATNTLLGTLPVGARPVSTVFCPFVKAGVAYGTIRIETNGEIYVGFISSTTASNRIYFNCSYPVV